MRRFCSHLVEHTASDVSFYFSVPEKERYDEIEFFHERFCFCFHFFFFFFFLLLSIFSGFVVPLYDLNAIVRYGATEQWRPEQNYIWPFVCWKEWVRVVR